MATQNIKYKISQVGAEKVSSSFKKLGGMIAGTFALSTVINYGSELVTLGNKIKGVETAFRRLDNGNLLEKLRIATKGTIDDLQLMSSATFAEKMKIPMDVLAKGFEFAGYTALETGQDINYMMESFVTGTARQSIMILDNLGISSKELSTEVKKTGDFMIALGNIMDRQLRKMRGGMDETIIKTKQMNTLLENQKQEISVGIASAWNVALGEGTKYFVRGIKFIELFADMMGEALKPENWFNFDALETFTRRFATEIAGLTPYQGMGEGRRLYEGVMQTLRKSTKETIPVIEDAGDKINDLTEEINKYNAALTHSMDIMAKGVVIGAGGEAGIFGTATTGLGRLNAINRGTNLTDAMQAGLEDVNKKGLNVFQNWQSVLTTNMNQAWFTIFGEANSLMEQFVTSMVNQILNAMSSQAVGGFLGFLDFIPGVGTAARAIDAIASGPVSGSPSTQKIVVQIGDIVVEEIYLRGNQIARRRGLA